MKVFYDPAEEYLPYILQSALWSYNQSMEKRINESGDAREVEGLLHKRKLLKEIIEPALKDPMAGSELTIVCDDNTAKEMLMGILDFYLEETRDIINTIKDSKITEKCNHDIDVIENEIISAIKVKVEK